MKKKNFIFFSTSRADLTLVKSLYKIIELPKSVKKIFFILDKIENKKINTKNFSKIISNFFAQFYEYLKKNSPSHIVILGDRFEVLALALAANFLDIKIIHFHGGEVSKGSLDDIWRDKISKISDYHFVSHEKYKKNLIEIGINKNNIFDVGAVGAYLVHIHKEKKIKTKNFKKNILMTYHPATKNIKKSNEDFLELLSAIEILKDYYFLITYPGYDIGSDSIIKKLNKLKNFKNIKIVKKVYKYHFYDYLKNFDLFIGNSSSGIIEAASANIPFLNIGNRQAGRIFSNNTYHVDGNKKKILFYVNKILSKKRSKYNNIYLKHNFIKNLNQKFKKII